MARLRELIAADLAVYSPARGGAIGFLLALLLPNFVLVLHYRLASALCRRGRLGRIVAMLIWRRSVRSGCHLSPYAEIGPGLWLPHSTGVVIGDGAVLGARVVLFQNVTIGSRGGPSRVYPVIGDDVIVYPGAVVVGGVRIGRGARVGANAFVSVDVAEDATVAGVPARVLPARPAKAEASA